MFALALVVLMFASTFVILSGSVNTANAQTTTIPSNMLQYEWTSLAASPTRTMFSSGPAPNSPNIAFKATIPGIAGKAFHYNTIAVVAFSGMVFTSVPSLTVFGDSYNGGVYAFDAATGKLVWSRLNVSGNPVKIDSTYMVVGSRCLKIADGTDVWVGPAGFAAGQNTFSGVGYVPELKMFLDQQVGWNLPDPSKPPTLAWNITNQANVNPGACTYGDSKLFVLSGDYKLKAYDAKTGNLLWTTITSSTYLYGASYYNGMVIHGGLDNTMRAWDANTGKLIWSYNPHTWYGQWASTVAVAYGIAYEHNQDNYIYAINATTGKLIWKQTGPGIWYSNIPIIADGKVYCQMGENEYRDFNTGNYGTSEYNCYDAYTGKLIWTLGVEAAPPQMQQCIAYGNIYLSPSVSENSPGIFFGSTWIGELWCISSQVTDYPMFLGNPAHSAEGAGPTNLALKWTFATGGPVISSATCSNGVAYFGSTDTYIYAVDANTGAKKWAFKTGFDIYSSVAVANGKVFTGADDGNIYAIDANTGTQVWKTFAGGVTNSLLGIGYSQLRSSPMFLNGRVYVGALDGNLYCLNGDNGDVIWKFKGVEPCVILATPTIYGDAIYLPSTRGGWNIRLGLGPSIANGDFYKLDLNGHVIWHKEIPYVLDKTPTLGNWLFASATVAPEMGLVFLRNGYRLNYAIKMDTGDTVWTYDGKFNPGTPNQLGGTPQIDAMLYKYGRLYFNDFYGVVCLNATNGQEIWYTYLSREINAQGSSYAYGRVYVATESGVLFVLDALNGHKLSYNEFGGTTVQIHSVATPYDGKLYLGTQDWNMYCFGEARLMSAKSEVGSVDTPVQAVIPVSSNTIATTNASTTAYATIAVATLVAITAASILIKRRK